MGFEEDETRNLLVPVGSPETGEKVKEVSYLIFFTLHFYSFSAKRRGFGGYGKCFCILLIFFLIIKLK